MLSKEIITGLCKIAGRENVLVEPEDLVAYSYDGTHLSFRPEAVIVPGTTEEISQIMKLAQREKIPVVARGGGTNVSGGSLAVHGGMVIALHRLNRIIEMNTENLTAVVEAGVITSDFHRAVEKEGLFFPPDPSSQGISTLGGNAAENAGGPRGLKYGVTRDYILGLEVVLADGTILKTGSKTIKNVSGYDLTRLFVGSEGTLGIITKLTIRLIPFPEAQKTLLAVYDNLDDGAETVSAIIREKIVPTTLELMDRDLVEAIENFKPSGLPLDADVVILIEVDGSQAEVERQIEKVAEICTRYGAREIKIAKTQEESDRLWSGRRSGMGAMAAKCTTLISEDATIPRNKIPEFVRRIKKISAKYDVTILVLGHAGDGNLHPCLLTDERDAAKMERTEKAIEEMFQVTLEMGGTLSGEHGIGLMKNNFMHWEHGEEGIRVMRLIKQSLDPDHILNPGKLFPET